MKQCSKCESKFEDRDLFCPNCHSMLKYVSESQTNPKSNTTNDISKPARKKGSSNCWLFVRNWWYNHFANHFDNCSLYYEKNDLNIDKLR